MPWILGYGSLMDAAHAGRLIAPVPLQETRALVLQGFRRTFDVRYANDDAGAGRTDTDAQSAVAYLGVAPARGEIFVRGVRVQEDALPALDRQEYMYRRWLHPSLSTELGAPVWLYRACRAHDPEGWAPPGAPAVIDRAYLERCRRGLESLGAPPDPLLDAPPLPVVALRGSPDA